MVCITILHLKNNFSLVFFLFLIFFGKKSVVQFPVDKKEIMLQIINRNFFIALSLIIFFNKLLLQFLDLWLVLPSGFIQGFAQCAVETEKNRMSFWKIWQVTDKIKWVYWRQLPWFPFFPIHYSKERMRGGAMHKKGK